MNKQRISEELLELLEANGVSIRSEALGGSGGGLCRLKDQWIFFLDTQASAAETAAHCGQAVARLVDVESVYIKPEVRQFIENFAEK